MVDLRYPTMTDELWNDVRHFSKSEFDSKDKDGSGKGTGQNMRPRLIFALDALRGLVGARFIIPSGYRTPSHNKYVKGAPQSAHLIGNAVDVSTVRWTYEQRRDFIIYARKLGFNGVGIASNFIHIDMQPRVAAWIYRNGGQVGIPLVDELKYV